MTGSVLRIVALVAANTASAIAVWKVQVVVQPHLGPVGATLSALVAALMLGGLLWTAAVASSTPAARGHATRGRSVRTTKTGATRSGSRGQSSTESSRPGREPRGMT
jgi:hypothetical protein